MKIQDANSPSEKDAEWISGLKFSHRSDILNPRGWLCSDVMNKSMDIISKQFKNINGFQLSNLAPEYDKETNSWKCRNKFQPMLVLPSAQIHYTGRDHWVMSFQNQENEVCILNSLSNTKNHTVS